MTIQVLSELEGVCLGLVGKYEPCTPYRVRQELKAAPSSHWQASAGSVYPLLARLEAQKLVKQTADPADGRGRKLLHISRQGRAALRKWLLTGAGPEVISSMTDPVRSRMFFLDALSEAQQRAYLDKLVSEMTHYLGKTKDHLGTLNEDDDPCNYLASLGAVRIAEARAEWLQEVVAILANGDSRGN
jgi:DNA-binding PadR family transcriptional regulator